MASRRARSLLVVAGCCLAPLVPSRVAHAQTAPAAESPEALLAQGVELRRHGDDEQALAVFRRAYDATHSGQALGQVALAEQALGRWTEAERDLAQALTTSDPWIVRNRTTLAAALETVGRHLGSLTVVADVAGAEVYANAQRIGTLPFTAPARIPVGSVVIEVRHPRYVTARRTVEMEPGGVHREAFTLVPRADDGADAREPAPDATRVTRTNATVAPPAAPAATPGSARGTAGIAALVGGGVLLVGGVVANVYWQNRVALYNDNSQCFYYPLSRDERCGAVLDNVRLGKALTIGLYTAGGVVALAGVVLLFTAPSSHAAAVARACAAPAPGDIGLSCVVRF